MPRSSLLLMVLYIWGQSSEAVGKMLRGIKCECQLTYLFKPNPSLARVPDTERRCTMNVCWVTERLNSERLHHLKWNHPQRQSERETHVVWAGLDKSGNAAVFNTFKACIYLNVSLGVRHVLGTSFPRWRDSVATETPWLSQEEKFACLLFIW